jgi:arginase
MVNYLGIPYDANSSYERGPSEAPRTFRKLLKHNPANEFAECGTAISAVNTKDLGDIFFSNEEDKAGCFDLIQSTVLKALKTGERLICIGGDHSVSFPILKAYAQRYDKITLVHFDAHPDLYGNFEGNYFSHASPFARIMEHECCDQLIQIGIRTMNDLQKKNVELFNVIVIPASSTFEQKKKKLEQVEGNIYLSLDLDVMDPAFVPGISHPEPGGMSVRELIELIKIIPGMIIGADIVEYNPTKDQNHVTGLVLYKLFKEIAAKMLDQLRRVNIQ